MVARRGAGTEPAGGSGRVAAAASAAEAPSAMSCSSTGVDDVDERLGVLPQVQVADPDVDGESGAPLRPPAHRHLEADLYLPATGDRDDGDVGLRAPAVRH